MWIVGSSLLVGCSSTEEEKGRVQNALEGDIVELEGQQDQYGWFPHMRLTFDKESVTEVYFDYVNDTGAKKSQDEEYNAAMKEKTGVDSKEAMLTLRQRLLDTQDPSAIDVIAGATQTSTEFIDMATQAMTTYKNGGNSANNYGKGDPLTNEDDGNNEQETKAEGEKSSSKTEMTYENGGDGSPNTPENSKNSAPENE